MWVFFFFNDTATTEIYTLSLHDALPISIVPARHVRQNADPSSATHSVSAPHFGHRVPAAFRVLSPISARDRKSTRLNSSHDQISYAVFCLKKKKKTPTESQAE